MRFPLCASALRAAAAALLWAVAASAVSPPRPAAAQTPRDDSDQMERVEVREVRFHGVKSVDLGELREALATKPSHCLGLIQKPFCLFTKSPYFYERRYLDREEFRRDVVRLLVFYYRRGWRDARVDTTVTQVDERAVRVDFEVTEGEPTRVDVVHLRPDHQVTDETIRNSLSFEPGDLFRRAEIAQSQRALYESNLFRSALIDTAVARDAATGRTVCAQQSALTPAAPADTAAAARASGAGWSRAPASR